MKRVRIFSACAPLLFCMVPGAWVSCTTATTLRHEKVWSAERQICPQGAETSGSTPRLDDTVQPRAYDLRLEASPDADKFAATLHINVEITRATCGIRLHARGLTITSALFEDEAGGRTVLRVRERAHEEQLVLEGPSAFLPQRARVTLTYTGVLNEDNSGLYRARAGGESYLITQMEPLSARRIFPCFDEPAFKVPLSLSVVAPESLAVISNEETLGSQTQGDGRKLVVFRPTPPLPTYLYALAIGPFDERHRELAANAHRTLPLKVRAFAVRGKGDALERALEQVEALLPAMERYFAGPFPFSKLDLVAVPHFAANGMENAGAIFMRDWLLTLDPKLATAEQRADQVSVLAHELSHQWFGNWVTMSWWDDLWLNEGFATWFGIKIADEVYPKGHFESLHLSGNHFAMGADMLQSTRRIRQPCRDANDIFSAFDAITYRKGAALLGMMEYQVGRDRFARGIQTYVNQYAQKNATSADFLKAMRDRALGAELVESLRSFLDRPGVPEVTYHLTCDANHPTLHLSQARYAERGLSRAPEPGWQVPVCWRLIYPNMSHEAGQKAEETCALLTGIEGNMRLPEEKGCPSAIVPNADGVGYFISHLSSREFAALDGSCLRPLEMGSLLHDVEAGLFSGRLTFAEAKLRTGLVLSAPSWPALRSVFRIWRLAFDALPEKRRLIAKDSEQLRAFRKRLKPFVFDSVAAQHADLVGTARTQVARFVARDLGDRDSQRVLVRLGAKLLADGAAPEALPAELKTLAVAMALEANPVKAFARARMYLQKDGVAADMRQTCLEAMAQVTTQESQRLLFSLFQETFLTSSDLLTLIAGQLEEGRARGRFWSFFLAQAAPLAKRLSGWEARNLMALTGWMTTATQATQAEETFAPLVGEVTGGAQALRHATEAIRVRARVIESLRPPKP